MIPRENGRHHARRGCCINVFSSTTRQELDLGGQPAATASGAAAAAAVSVEEAKNNLKRVLAEMHGSTEAEGVAAKVEVRSR